MIKEIKSQLAPIGVGMILGGLGYAILVEVTSGFWFSSIFGGLLIMAGVFYQEGKTR